MSATSASVTAEESSIAPPANHLLVISDMPRRKNCAKLYMTHHLRKSQNWDTLWEDKATSAKTKSRSQAAVVQFWQDIGRKSEAESDIKPSMGATPSMTSSLLVSGEGPATEPAPGVSKPMRPQEGLVRLYTYKGTGGHSLWVKWWVQADFTTACLEAYSGSEAMEETPTGKYFEDLEPLKGLVDEAQWPEVERRTRIWFSHKVQDTGFEGLKSNASVRSWDRYP